MNLYYGAKLVIPVALADVPVDQAVALGLPAVVIDDPTVLSATKQVVNGGMQLVVEPLPNSIGKTAVITVTLGGVTTYPVTVVGGSATLDLASASYVPMS